MAASDQVGIVDYGLGNLRSVQAAVERAGATAIVSGSAADLEACSKLILPGVGAFGDGMRNLRDRNLVDPLCHMVLEEKKPILGICLGAQLMARESEEFGHHGGLQWLDASVIRFDVAEAGLRVPHMGWNDLRHVKTSLLFTGIPSEALYYFCHSFHIVCHDPSLVVGQSEYGQSFTAVAERANIFAVQFHPEKSQQQGISVLRNFLEIPASDPI